MQVRFKNIDRSTTVDKVAATLRQAMFCGDLAPGAPLREVALSESLGVARSTIREALRVLTADGFVTRMANRGLAVRHLTVADVEDIFAARLILEREAAQATATCPDAVLKRLAQALDGYTAAASTGDPALAADAHVEFHAVMVGLTGSRRLAATERALMQDLQLVIASIDKSSDDLPHEIQKHAILADLFCHRRVAEAIACLEEDLKHAKAFVIRHAIDGPASPAAD